MCADYCPCPYSQHFHKMSTFVQTAGDFSTQNVTFAFFCRANSPAAVVPSGQTFEGAMPLTTLQKLQLYAKWIVFFICLISGSNQTWLQNQDELIFWFTVECSIWEHSYDGSLTKINVCRKESLRKGWGICVLLHSTSCTPGMSWKRSDHTALPWERGSH